MSFDDIKKKMLESSGLELNRLKNHARRMYALGEIDQDQWKELEKIADQRYGT